MTPARTLLTAWALAAASLAAHAQPLAEPRPYAGHAVVRAELRDLRDVRTLNALSDDPWTCGWDGLSPGLIDFRLAPDALEALAAADIPFQVLIPDVQALIDRERAEWRAPAAAAGDVPTLRGPGGGLGAAFFADYQPLESINGGLTQLAASRPNLASVRGLGPSVLGREIQALRITGPGDAATRPAVFIHGAQHAREWITPAACMYLADALVSRYDTDARIRRLVDAFEWHIVPVANPDGYAHTWTTGNRLWRKNRRTNSDGTFGVDINRNWSVGFGVTGSSNTPGSDTYRGPEAFSEPETRALRDAMIALPNLLFHVDVHSFGQLILEPLGYTHTLPTDAAAYAAISAAMQQPMFDVDGRIYSPGPINRNIYPVGGGAVDWANDASGGAGTLSLSFELRDTGSNGFVLPADQIVPASEEHLAGILAAVERLLERPLDVQHVDGAPARVAADGVTPIDVRILRGGRKPDPLAAPVLRQRSGRVGAFGSQVMTAAGGDETGPIWRGTLTAGPCGSVVQYWFETVTAGGEHVRVPADGRVFEAVAQGFETVYAQSFDDAAGAPGWLASEPTDTAAAATRWTLGDPDGTVAQAEFDRTPREGVRCFFTGVNPRNNATNGDVDGGRTTLLSPVLDLSAYTSAEVSLWIWYSNNRGATGTAEDELAVEVSASGAAAAPAWVRALTLRAQAPIAQSTAQWRRYDLRLEPLIPLTSQVRLRIVAADLGSASTVEAAVDDVTVRGLLCHAGPCPGDFDGSGQTSVEDIFVFLASYFAGDADINNSGQTGLDDLFEFLARWFSGC